MSKVRREVGKEGRGAGKAGHLKPLGLVSYLTQTPPGKIFYALAQSIYRIDC